MNIQEEIKKILNNPDTGKWSFDYEASLLSVIKKWALEIVGEAETDAEDLVVNRIKKRIEESTK